MILMVVGICQGMIVETAQRQNGIGADIFLRPPNASVMFSTAGDRIPTADAEKLRPLSQIRALSPVLTQLETSDGLVNIFGIDYASFTAVSSGFTFLEGGPFSSETADEILIDDLYQRSKGLKVGDTPHTKGTKLQGRWCGTQWKRCTSVCSNQDIAGANRLERPGDDDADQDHRCRPD